jgi:hypothetical protein
VNQDTSNEIDLDTPEAQKMFADAFASAAKGETIKLVEPTPVVETPAVTASVPEPKTEQPVVENTSTDPATMTSKEDAPKTEAKQVNEPKKYDVPDWAKDLPDAVKENLSKELQEKLYYQQKYKSDFGRQSALQRKLFETRKEMEALRAQIAKPQDPALAAAAKQDEAKALELWEQLKQADSNLANAIESRLKVEANQVRTELNSKVDATVNPLNQHIEESYVDEQRRLLQEQVPNLHEVISSPVYAEWINNRAPPGIRNLALNSVDHQDALTVLRVYSQEGPQVYNEMVRSGRLPAPPTEAVTTPTQSPTTSQQANTAHADKVAERREQKIEAAPVVRQVPNPVAAAAAVSASWNSPGGKLDIDDPTSQAAFADAFKKYQRTR